ncbi:MAG: hypothetical protein ABSC88_10325 [Terracidiphilus sp.]|jgi:hypothetical protein
MNRINNDSEEMELSRIDHILASEEPLIPSSGFLASVMERVHEEATAPPPIPFPWKRAIPGMVLAAGVFGWGAFEFVRYGLPAVGSIALTPPHLSAAVARPLEQVGWVALALGASLLSWLLSRRLAGRGGLL